MPGLFELFRDDRFVVVDKPSGLPSHAGPRGGASVESYFPEVSRRRRGPWLVHRLDADTSGCLVIALRRAALLQAQACFAEGRANKTYWAIVQGSPAADSGTIEARLSKRNSPNHGWRMQVDPSGDPAVTDFSVMHRSGGLAWLALHPRTGRTHQIRVHCAHAGFPLVGDARYGGPPGGLHLLARAIELPLDPRVAATAPLPPPMRATLAAMGVHSLPA